MTAQRKADVDQQQADMVSHMRHHLAAMAQEAWAQAHGTNEFGKALAFADFARALDDAVSKAGQAVRYLQSK